MPNSVTMRDIARRLGVSAMTISRALSNSPKVSLETQQCIVQEAARMGYQTNPYLRCWMANRRRNQKAPQQVALGLLNLWVPSSSLQTRLHCRQIQEGCVHRAEELGYRIDVICPKESGISVTRLHKILQNRAVRGLLIPPLPASHSHLRLNWNYYSAVAMGFTLRYPNLNRVTLNPVLAMQMIIRNLKRARYKRIGLAVSNSVARRLSSHHVAAFLLYQSSLSEKDQVPVCWLGVDPSKQIRRWVRQYQPDAVVAETAAVFRLLRGIGVRIPEELGVAIFSRYEEDSNPEPGIELTGMDLGNRLIGARAVEMLASQMERLEYGVPESPASLMVQPRWCPGTTIRSVGQLLT